jgi:Farnesoic acid 0-methyl transferase
MLISLRLPNLPGFSPLHCCTFAFHPNLSLLHDQSEFRGFKLSWKGGLITLEDAVGGVILQHQDSESAPITHYGIRTSWGASGEWKLGGDESQQQQPAPSAPAPPAPAETRAAPGTD